MGGPVLTNVGEMGGPVLTNMGEMGGSPHQYGGDGRTSPHQYGGDGRTSPHQYGGDGRTSPDQYGGDGRTSPHQYGGDGRTSPDQYGGDGRKSSPIPWAFSDTLTTFSSQDDRPTGTIPLAGNKVKRHPDDPKQPNMFKFEIEGGQTCVMLRGGKKKKIVLTSILLHSSRGLDVRSVLPGMWVCTPMYAVYGQLH